MSKAMTCLFGTILALGMVSQGTLGASSDQQEERKVLLSDIRPQSIPKHVLNNTHKVRSSTANGATMEKGYGSAFGVDLSDLGIDGRRYLITAAHVIVNGAGEISDKVEIEVRSDKHNSRVNIPVKVIAYDRESDIALLMADVDLEDLAKVLKDDDLEVGDPILSVGCPLGGGVVPSWGYLVSKSNQEFNGQNPATYQGSSNIYVGNSGGPVWNPKSNSITGVVVQALGYGNMGIASNAELFVNHESIVKFLTSKSTASAMQDGGKAIDEERKNNRKKGKEGDKHEAVVEEE